MANRAARVHQFESSPSRFTTNFLRRKGEYAKIVDWRLLFVPATYFIGGLYMAVPAALALTRLGLGLGMPLVPRGKQGSNWYQAGLNLNGLTFRDGSLVYGSGDGADIRG